MTHTRPVAISCGEPAGIGPEIAAKAWAELRTSCPMLWLGDPRHLPAGTPYQEVAQPQDAAAICPQALPVLKVPFAGDANTGTPDPRNASGVIAAIETAVSLVRTGEASAICTAPIHKKALIDGASFAYPGHTEFLAHLAGRDRVVMMLASDQLRVVPTTIHIALSEVPRALTPDLLRETIAITAEGLRRQFGISKPRIAVAGLNPHAGEGGAMGREELEWIAPLIAELQSPDMTLTGPHPADTMFHATARARYDAAVCMYHDQALIPIKTLDFDRGVNVTLGLPFIRTSPDHGTAFDIAGTGQANPSSMIEALKMAQRMALATTD
ncbi:4-hydroxythreonine-4-phosphate dehydrogenase PdxA [Phaeobacter gallaeciensis]|uniref:4-hydroxythreonine-4-phosphate dehydrogenase PdxA n=1 Tax=Phaeobacter gallaeciensis TaxID=60890 RepID=UPI00237F25A0|nr:4-hydroxythreonine-4-phosphate dehydrogenase PdxA [Phaeobacter gallaeciensis]MDE4189758.1 4-hydroxythreonine-4-phosphate dehydrogenase PdxA [Phaeobacter gallaeciensis]MDE4198911.1 4-hydroxythreonine-4-phosphate dehydrogenase PdxA [Phaeobacter gallaeciensis]MDE4203058.1 4-hydroxythreonine-4-phosphate dehydrogenase PdxA [Phaeobacter gallaeciensis]MDE4207200.1 4-hydroxythreonine-4-phosphate dehydrogenase PdxA [Phaeobacter gallaeciensis]MDE4215576.1 4-hydroxythreonine-4-phosphate dehydrogenase 